MKLIMENWRSFLKETDTARAPWDSTGPAKLGAIKPMDPRDVKTPAAVTAPGAVSGTIPQVQLSGEIQTHNANKLHEYFEDDTRVRSVFLSGWSEEGHPNWREYQEKAKQYIDFMVANNPIFQNNKIVENLGAGSFGFVVQLDNDHALKIYVGSFDPTTRGTDPTARLDIERYTSSRERAFGGTSEPGELHIYDQGEIETPFGKKWFYAEMQQLRTLSKFMREFAHPDKDAREVTDGVDYEITFLKELAHLATLVDKHGAQAIAEFDPEEAYAAQHGRAFPEEHEDEIKLDPDWGITIDSKPRADEPTQLAEFAELLEQGNLDAIFNTTGYKGRAKLFLLDKTYAKNLFKQLKELLKAKTLRDLADVRGANIGVSTTDESLPIIFDY